MHCLCLKPRDMPTFKIYLGAMWWNITSVFHKLPNILEAFVEFVAALVESTQSSGETVVVMPRVDGSTLHFGGLRRRSIVTATIFKKYKKTFAHSKFLVARRECATAFSHPWFNLLAAASGHWRSCVKSESAAALSIIICKSVKA